MLPKLMYVIVFMYMYILLVNVYFNNFILFINVIQSQYLGH